MLGITVGIFYVMSHDTNYGYKKILGLRGDRQKKGQKRSLEAQADAFSRLKSIYYLTPEVFQHANKHLAPLVM